MKLDTNVASPPTNLVRVWPGSLPLLEVDSNDRVWFVQEGYGAGPGHIGTHRYQIMYLPFADTMMAYWTDLGPESDFIITVDDTPYNAPPYQQLVLGEHTVDECIHMANQCRMDEWQVQLLHTQVNESDLFEKYRRMIEEDQELVRNRSSYGAYQRTERNGYSPLHAREQLLKEGNS